MLQYSLLQNEQILNSMTDGIIGLDTMGVVTFANSAALKMLGWELEDLIGKCFHYAAHHSRPDGTPYPEEKCGICFHFKESAFKVEDEAFWRKNGSSFAIKSVITPVLAGEDTIGNVIVFKDITESRQNEKERLLLATAIDQAAESIMITDQNGVIQYVNPAFMAISGYEAEEVIGQKPRILRSGKHDREFYSRLWKTLLSGQVWKGRFVNRRKDGSLYEMNGTISPVRDASGNVTNFVTVRRDVTNEARFERQLRQSQKMEAVGTFAGGIAHDFNNILMAVVGYTEMALTHESLPESVCDGLNQVLSAGHRARELVKQILTFCREEEQQRTPMQMSPLVKEAVKFLRASLPSTVEIRQNIMSGLGNILADPTQMHQVLMNLCANAAHAMRETGGTLEIGLKDLCLDTEDMVRYPGLEAGAYQSLTVSDTGHGMDQTTLERIFEPFFTTKEKGEGTGMGLATVHGIVQNHGGAISVYSEPGKGTSFHLLFPRIETRSCDKLSPAAQIPTGKERILFVDDEEMLVHLGQRILENLGYEVTAKSNSSEALAVFRKQPDLFDLVITDQTMPKLTGVELAKEILRMRPLTRIILCTGFTELVSCEEAKSMGISEFVTKPIGKHQLAEIVRRVLDVA